MKTLVLFYMKSFSGIMTSSEILWILTEEYPTKSKVVITLQHLNRLRSGNYNIVIINLGNHWILVLEYLDTVIYFDSLGQQPGKEVLEYLSRYDNEVIYLIENIQKKNENCGWVILVFLKLILKDKTSIYIALDQLSDTTIIEYGITMRELYKKSRLKATRQTRLME